MRAVAAEARQDAASAAAAATTTATLLRPGASALPKRFSLLASRSDAPLCCVRIRTHCLINSSPCCWVRADCSPGKPRIAGTAILDFTLELVAVPGKDDEILEMNGLID